MIKCSQHINELELLTLVVELMTWDLALMIWVFVVSLKKFLSHNLGIISCSVKLGSSLTAGKETKHPFCF